MLGYTQRQDLIEKIRDKSAELLDTLKEQPYIDMAMELYNLILDLQRDENE